MIAEVGSEIRKTERRLSYFGSKEEGKGTLYLKYTSLPAFQYICEAPLHISRQISEESSKNNVLNKLRFREAHNFDRFLVAPDRKNVWAGGIRSQCEGVLSAKTYISSNEDRGVYTVIPEIETTKVTIDGVYKMWLALECAMIRRESLIIVENPALAEVTKFRTEQWRLLNRFVRWGCGTSMFFAVFFRTYPFLYIFPFCLAFYGAGMLRAMMRKDPAYLYSECCVNKQYELDPDSHFTCDAEISLKYLRSPQYRMFKLENHEQREVENLKFLLLASVTSVVQMFRTIYDFDIVPHMVKRGFYDANMKSQFSQPLNIFQQLRKRLLPFGNNSGPGRADTFHWLVQNALFYYFFAQHTPWALQQCLEFLEREHAMETTIRYLQFRNLCGEERYEFPARNLYWTMQKDFPNNRILKEMYDHFNDPPEGYYESQDFLETREPEVLSLKEVIRRWKISYNRRW